MTIFSEVEVEMLAMLRFMRPDRWLPLWAWDADPQFGGYPQRFEAVDRLVRGRLVIARLTVSGPGGFRRFQVVGEWEHELTAAVNDMMIDATTPLTRSTYQEMKLSPRGASVQRAWSADGIKVIDWTKNLYDDSVDVFELPEAENTINRLARDLPTRRPQYTEDFLLQGRATVIEDPTELQLAARHSQIPLIPGTVASRPSSVALQQPAEDPDASHEPATDDIDEEDRKILLVCKKQCTDGRRLPAAMIVASAFGPSADPQSYKHALAALAKRGFLDTARGRKPYAITPKGLAAVAE